MNTEFMRAKSQIQFILNFLNYQHFQHHNSYWLQVHFCLLLFLVDSVSAIFAHSVRRRLDSQLPVSLAKVLCEMQVFRLLMKNRFEKTHITHQIDKFITNSTLYTIQKLESKIPSKKHCRVQFKRWPNFSHQQMLGAEIGEAKEFENLGHFLDSRSQPQKSLFPDCRPLCLLLQPKLPDRLRLGDYIECPLFIQSQNLSPSSVRMFLYFQNIFDKCLAIIGQNDQWEMAQTLWGRIPYLYYLLGIKTEDTMQQRSLVLLTAMLSES